MKAIIKVFFFVFLFLGCTDIPNQKVTKIKSIEVHQIPFDILFPVDIGNDLVVDNPNYIRDEQVLKQIQLLLSNLQVSRERYSNNTYMRCVIRYENGEESKLFFNRFIIRFQEVNYINDTNLISILSSSDNYDFRPKK